jgi:hypothetical protein
MSNREQMILDLTQADLEWLLTSGDSESILTQMLMVGNRGFQNMTDEELEWELHFRKMEIPE